MNVFLGIETPKVIYETDSKYNGHIQVVQFGSKLRVRVDGYDQSISPDSSACSRLYWGKVVDILKENQPDFKNILMLGLGGGTLAHLLNKNFPDAKITAVDIDSTMVDIAKKYFSVDQIPNLNIVVADAMRVVIDPEAYSLKEYMFDTLLVDIYVGDKYPDLGKSGNFISAIKRMVVPGGLVIFNRIYREHHQDEVNTFIDYVENMFSGIKCTVVAGHTNSDNILIYGRTN